MKYYKLKLIAVLLFFKTLTAVQAQEALPATGGEASGNGGSVSYSVGQAVYTASTGSNGTLTAGVQQAFEISLVSGIEDAHSINLSVIAYPNPTTDYLTLSIHEFDISNLSYQLYDNQGKLLKSEKITDQQSRIGMSSLIASSYFVKVFNNSTELKTFKIIKN